MLIEEAREAQRNHAPVRLVGDLYFIEGFKGESGVDSGPVAILIRAFHQKYAKEITVEPAYLMKLSERELKQFHEEAKKEE